MPPHSVVIRMNLSLRGLPSDGANGEPVVEGRRAAFCQTAALARWFTGLTSLVEEPGCIPVIGGMSGYRKSRK